MKAKLLSGFTANAACAVVFNAGGEFREGFTTFARELSLGGGHFTAIGGFSRAIPGYFDVAAKGYRHIPLEETLTHLRPVIDEESGFPLLALSPIWMGWGPPCSVV